MARLNVTEQEKLVVRLVTVLTNLSALPTLWVLWNRQGCSSIFIIGCWITSISICYHWSETTEDRSLLGIDEGSWHRLDNIGAIHCFVVLALYYSFLSSQRAYHLLQNLNLCALIILEELCPWNLFCTFLPIVTVTLFIFLPHLLYLQTWFTNPNLQVHWHRVGWAALFQILAVVGFVIGLDEDYDRLRAWHSSWHLFGGLAAYFEWTAVTESGKYHSR